MSLSDQVHEELRVWGGDVQGVHDVEVLLGEKQFKYRFILVKKYAISFGRVLSITSLTHILQDKHRTAIFCFEQAQETH